MTSVSRLSLATVLLLVLWVFGDGLVRTTNAGASAAAWPRAVGGWWPPFSEAALTRRTAAALHQSGPAPVAYQGAAETNLARFWLGYGYRWLGLAATVVALLTAGCVWRQRQALPAVHWPAVAAAAGALLAFALDCWLLRLRTPAHLLVVRSLLIYVALGLQLYVYLLVNQDSVGLSATEVTGRRTFRWLGLLLLGTLLHTAAGIELQVEMSAVRAQWPGLSPIELMARVGMVKYLHVGLGLAVVVGTTLIAARLFNRDRYRHPLVLAINPVLLALVYLELGLGAGFVVLGAQPALRVMHPWLAVVIVGLQVVLLVVLRQGQSKRALPPHLMWQWAGGAALATVVFLGAAMVLTTRARGEAAAGLGNVPPFNLECAQGGSVASQDLAGRLTVFNFFFATCQTVCPVMNAQVAALYREFAAEPRVQLLSLTTDPAQDTAPALSAYATAFGVTDTRWRFLRAPADEVRRLAFDGFHVTDQLPLHSPALILIGPQGRLLGYYNSQDPARLAALRADLRRLLGAMP